MAKIPEKRVLLEDAWEVLANMDFDDKDALVGIEWARTTVMLANSLPEIQDARPFRDVIG